MPEDSLESHFVFYQNPKVSMALSKLEDFIPLKITKTKYDLPLENHDGEILLPDSTIYCG